MTPHLSTGTELSPVVLERSIAAPVERVWRAWTDPARVARWFSPNPSLATTVELDLRPGGAWSVLMGRYGVRGEYVEVDEPRRLSFTWRFDHEPEAPPTLVEVVLHATGDGTRLVLTHSGHPSVEDRDGTAEGWVLSLDRLLAVVE